MVGWTWYGAGDGESWGIVVTGSPWAHGKRVGEQTHVPPCRSSEELSLHHRHPVVRGCSGPWTPRGGAVLVAVVYGDSEEDLS